MTDIFAPLGLNPTVQGILAVAALLGIGWKASIWLWKIAQFLRGTGVQTLSTYWRLFNRYRARQIVLCARDSVMFTGWGIRLCLRIANNSLLLLLTTTFVIMASNRFGMEKMGVLKPTFVTRPVAQAFILLAGLIATVIIFEAVAANVHISLTLKRRGRLLGLRA